MIQSICFSCLGPADTSRAQIPLCLCLFLLSGWNQSLRQMWGVLWQVCSSPDYWPPHSSDMNIQQRGHCVPERTLQITGAHFFSFLPERSTSKLSAPFRSRAHRGVKSLLDFFQGLQNKLNRCTTVIKVCFS